jgi:hypothetical protein
MTLLAALLSAAALMGQTAPPPQTMPQTMPQTAPQDPTTVVPDVEVTGQRQSAYEAARSFVDEVVQTPEGRAMARWDGRVCVGVINLRGAAAQAIVDRVSQRMLDIGMDIGEPGCRPNIMIIATTDGAATARALVQARPRNFNPGFTGTRLTLNALEKFQANDNPIRAWRLTVPVDADTGAPTVRLPGEDFRYRAIRQPSRLRTLDRNVFARTFVILDVAQTNGFDTGAIGDYIAMVSLAQIDAEADVSGYSSILNLFTDPSGSREMTDWDLGYLRSLYAAELSEAHTAQQEGNIAERMTNQPAPVPPASTPQ